MTPPSNAAEMIQARRQDSDTKRTRVLAALQHLHDQGAPITFAAVARQAGVSTWLVYAPGVREHIDRARARQRSHPAADDRDARARGVETDLALARSEIRKLRAERHQHQQQLQRALGARLDNIAKADLLARVDELTHANTELTSRIESYQHDNEILRTRVSGLEEDLAAARTSLRRMIRTENRPAGS